MLSDFFKDPSKKPFFLYWLTLTVVLADAIVCLIWFSLFYPGIDEMLKDFFVRRFYLSPLMQWLIILVFIGCMLRWPDWGILFVSIYLLRKILMYCSIFGLHVGTREIGQPVSIPNGLIVWEVLSCLILVVLYMAVVFGWYSRQLEFQADIHACDLLSRGAEPAAAKHQYQSVLGKLEVGARRQRRTWLHPSASQRLQLMDDICENPSRRRRFDRRLKFVTGFCLSALVGPPVLCIVVAVL